MKVLVVLIVFAVFVFGVWKFYENPYPDNTQGPFYTQNYAPRTAELEAVCDEAKNLTKLSSIKNVDGFSTKSEAGCHYACRGWLFFDKYKFVETYVGSTLGSYYARQKKVHHNLAQDGVGWYRFEIKKWGHPDGKRYEDYVRQERARRIDVEAAILLRKGLDPSEAGKEPDLAEINDEILKNNYSDERIKEIWGNSNVKNKVGLTITVQKIPEPTARYRRIHKFFGRRIINNGAIIVFLDGEEIIDTQTQTSIAQTAAVIGRLVKRNRKGELQPTLAKHYCGALKFNNEQLLSILSPASE